MVVRYVTFNKVNFASPIIPKRTPVTSKILGSNLPLNKWHGSLQLRCAESVGFLWVLQVPVIEIVKRLGLELKIPVEENWSVWRKLTSLVGRASTDP